MACTNMSRVNRRHTPIFNIWSARLMKVLILYWHYNYVMSHKLLLHLRHSILLSELDYVNGNRNMWIRENINLIFLLMINMKNGITPLNEILNLCFDANSCAHSGEFRKVLPSVLDIYLSHLQFICSKTRIFQG